MFLDVRNRGFIWNASFLALSTALLFTHETLSIDRMSLELEITDSTTTSVFITPDPSPSVEHKHDVFLDLVHSPVTNYSDPANLFAMPDLSTEVDHKPRDVLVYPFHSPAVASDLIATARALVHPRGKGIYATDETPNDIAAVLHAAAGGTGKPKMGMDETEKEKRRQWREAAYNAISSGQTLVILPVCSQISSAVAQITSPASFSTPRHSYPSNSALFSPPKASSWAFARTASCVLSRITMTNSLFKDSTGYSSSSKPHA